MGLIRLLLALAVVITHCQPHNYSVLDMTAGIGSVQIFYMISGFYMSLILNRKCNWTGASRSSNHWRFALELFPVRRRDALDLPAHSKLGLGTLDR